MDLDPTSNLTSNLMDSLVSPDPVSDQEDVIVDTTVTEKVVLSKSTGVKPVASPKAKPPPSVYLKNKSKWSAVSAACDSLPIYYTNARAKTMGMQLLTVIVNPDVLSARNLTGLLSALHIRKSNGNLLCGGYHTANYKECSRAPKFIKQGQGSQDNYSDQQYSKRP
ncbi:hypothetical protein EVAR_24591_1 [Eumeta japonica]|uniref:Uncharacterized protein n=1 Tax=Eumeta variegata TaxID=151549 RepID=A0A4C1W7N5_EUMVA|nr:hypothetical protein EVAR_24591_1 [Eumeta japonica]